MIIYNVTINVHESIHAQWKEWLTTAYIPFHLSTKLFTKARVVKVLVDSSMEGETYSVQFECPSREMLTTFYNDHADIIQQESLRLYGELMLTFKTELQHLSDY